MQVADLIEFSKIYSRDAKTILNKISNKDCNYQKIVVSSKVCDVHARFAEVFIRHHFTGGYLFEGACFSIKAVEY